MSFNPEAVRELRDRWDFTLQELGDLVGLSHARIAQLELGSYYTPHISMVDEFYRLAQELGEKDLQFYIPPNPRKTRYR